MPKFQKKFFAKSGTYVEKYRADHLCTKFEGNILSLRGHDCKKCVRPTFGCKVVQSDTITMKLKLDMLCSLLNVFTKF